MVSFSGDDPGSDRRSGRKRRVREDPKYNGTERRLGGDRRKKASICSFRIDAHLKQSLEAAAVREGRSLSALIVHILTQYMEEYEADSTAPVSRMEKRHYPRKEVILPARWRILREQDVGEHDVLVRNISVGGAYTEYANGRSFELVRDLYQSQLELVVRMPGASGPVSLDCEPRRMHITRDYLGVGLQFKDAIEGITP
jgi:predicted HicB family RNase H-like nuclease